MPGNSVTFADRLMHNLVRIIPWRFGDVRYAVACLEGALKYVTFSKVANFLKREHERLERSILPGGFPYHAVIDINNVCNLECPYCPTGRRQVSGRTKRTIDVGLVEEFIGLYGNHLLWVDLFNWGEPLLHPGIDRIVRLLHEKHIFHQISSNLNIRNKAVLEGICDAGLDLLIVSISGATQDVYERYHRRGDLSLVLENLRHIVEYKKRVRRFTPMVELQYLTFRHNSHQVEAASRMAREIGVDVFRSHVAGGPEEEIIQVDEDRKKSLYPDTGGLCCQLWRTVVLNSDGGIAPCCFLYFKSDDFTETLPVDDAIPKYVEARSLFNRRAANGLSTDLDHPCLKCSFVHRQKHLAHYLSANPNARQGHRTGGP